MSNYAKIVDYAAKDALLIGNPSKIVKGTEIGDEFDAVAVAIATKANSASPTFTGTVNTATGLSVGGATAGAGGIAFPATAVAVADPNTLDDYEEGSFTATGTGFTTSPTATWEYVKVGNMVVLTMATITGTSNSTSFTVTGMPATIRPSSTSRFVIGITSDNSAADAASLITINSAGVVTLFRNVAGNVFTGSGTKYVSPCSVSYQI